MVARAEPVRGGGSSRLFSGSVESADFFLDFPFSQG